MENTLDWYYKQIDKTPLLTKEQEVELSNKIRKGSEKVREKARNEMIEANLKLVMKIVTPYKKYGLEPEDLISEGNIGLTIAASKYDPSKGTKFSTYAAYWIRQKIMRALSDKSRTIRIPVYLTQDFSKILKFVDKFKAKNDSEPSTSEIAKGTGLTNHSVDKALFAYENAQASVSLDSPLSKDDETGEATVGDKIEDSLTVSPFQDTETANNSEVIFKFLNKLTKREKDIVSRRFGFGGEGSETLENIGESYKLTRERIRQIELEALKKLRVMIKKAYDSHI
jgi:RNA polymerase primary sigma factor